MKNTVIYIIVSFFSLIGYLYAQNSDTITVSKNSDANKKTIGLILSGGGAKGLAHIGVLRALEENDIPIDYIAGTSMGAIIGGLYASGYTIDEIEQIFFSEQLSQWLSGKIDDKYKLKVTSPSLDASLLQAEFDVKNKFKPEIPISLVNPIHMDFSFMDFFSSANEACNGNFDNLMIPFFCVASDVGQREQVILRSGNLPRCIRASMSFPFFFSPINIDGHIMCDGGVYNNFPSEQMQEFYSPDFMIGVKVVDNFDTPNEDDLLLYIENMVALASKYNLPNTNGIMIEPDMHFISIMDFSMIQECINRGYESAIKNMDKIKSYIPSRTTKKERNKKRQEFKSKLKPLKIDNIIIHGVSPHTKQYFDKLLTINLNKTNVSFGDLKDNYLNLATMPNIKSLQPTVYYDKFLKNYIFDLNIKTKNLLLVKTGGILSSAPISNMYLGLEYNFISKFAYTAKINTYFGRYYASSGFDFKAIVPNNVIPFYAETSINFNRWNYFRNRSGLFEYSASNYLVQQESNAQLRLGFSNSAKGKMVVKAGIGEINDKYFNNDYILNTDTNDVTKFRNFVLGISGERNTLDDDIFATYGEYVKVNVQYIRGTEDFTKGNSSFGLNDFSKQHSWIQMDLTTKIYYPFNKTYSLGWMTKTYYSFQELFATRRACLLNAGIFSPTIETFTRFYPEYRANQFFGTGIDNVFLLGKSFIGTMETHLSLFAFLPVRKILANDYNIPYYGDFFTDIYLIGNATFVIKTPFGNLNLSVSYHQRENPSNNPWNVSVSFGKLIFNNKNIER